MKSIEKILITGIIFILIVFPYIPIAQAKEIYLNDMNTVYFEDVVNTGKDSGYSKTNAIKKGDPHYGWKLGKFALTGFSSKRKDEKGNWILLKNVGDEITLYFNLLQNIDKLDKNENLKIAIDKNGYDNEFNIKPTNFGKGFLIIRKTDATGNKNEPEMYNNYLKGIKVGANTKVNIYEEGDYEVALDYEIVEKGFALFNNYHNYRIRFSFSIRNGNCMIYPFDVKTKEELKNTSITENGFYLDLANSKYLNVNIKKEVLKEGAEGLIEDTRFNRPAKSGEEFTEEGIYTITAMNEYTGETTIKKIYIGKDKILKAHVQTGRSIENIRELTKLGATIDEEGNLSNIPKEYQIEDYNTNKNQIIKNYLFVISILFIIVFVILKIIYNKKNKMKKRENHEKN